jgi:hypothetical protein
MSKQELLAQAEALVADLAEQHIPKGSTIEAVSNQ